MFSCVCALSGVVTGDDDMVQVGEESFFAKGIEALRNGQLFLATACFKHAAAAGDNLASCSYLAWCRAQTSGEYDESIALAEQVLAMEPTNPLHYLNLGRICRLAGSTQRAIDLLREGMTFDTSGEIGAELAQFGCRKPPLFPSLSRANPLNRYLGLLASSLGWR